MVDGRDSAWRNRAPGPHTHRTTARQAMDGLWTEARGQQKQSNDPGNNQLPRHSVLFTLVLSKGHEGVVSSNTFRVGTYLGTS